MVFRQFYHFIEFPEEFKEKIDKVETLDQKVELAFKLCFEESSFGKDNLYSFKHKWSTYYSTNPDPDVDKDELSLEEYVNLSSQKLNRFWVVLKVEGKINYRSILYKEELEHQDIKGNITL